MRGFSSLPTLDILLHGVERGVGVDAPHAVDQVHALLHGVGANVVATGEQRVFGLLAVCREVLHEQRFAHVMERLSVNYGVGAGALGCRHCGVLVWWVGIALHKLPHGVGAHWTRSAPQAWTLRTQQFGAPLVGTAWWIACDDACALFGGIVFGIFYIATVCGVFCQKAPYDG
ncbi:hypothetical protein DF22_001961 [Xylella fastidiosa]|nr:hypothetical protein M233_00390 [Xylella fastidiosa subsp. multiplex Griffin-1]KFA41382.1 hypothetical protein DF22_001961 [Xylella fastidiosa]MCO5546249.1 hypothetical protein [Xylella fastidiosa]OMK01063.1 hypothetical protein XYFPCFBP8417_01400 [Xylella fastidiosa subsp. multiplex]